MHPRYLLVPLVGALPLRVPDGVREPAAHVLPDGQFSDVEGEPVVAVRHRLRY